MKDLKLAKKMGKAFRAGMLYALGRRFAMDSDKWITVKPNGANHKGVPVMIDGETGKIKAGMGGKFNGNNIGELKKSFVGPKRSNASGTSTTKPKVDQYKDQIEKSGSDYDKWQSAVRIIESLQKESPDHEETKNVIEELTKTYVKPFHEKQHKEWTERATTNSFILKAIENGDYKGAEGLKKAKRHLEHFRMVLNGLEGKTYIDDRKAFARISVFVNQLSDYVNKRESERNTKTSSVSRLSDAEITKQMLDIGPRMNMPRTTESEKQHYYKLKEEFDKRRSEHNKKLEQERNARLNKKQESPQERNARYFKEKQKQREREVTSSTYERAQKRLHKEVNQFFGRGMEN